MRRNRFSLCFGAAVTAALCGPAAALELGKCEFGNGRPVKLTFLDSGLPLISGAMNGAPASFLFDTGASQTNLLMPKLKELGTFVKPMKSALGGTGGMVSYSMAKLNTLDIGPVRFTNQYLHVINNLHPNLMGKFDAILGMEHLAPNDFEVDIAAGRVQLHTGQCDSASTALWEQDAMSLPLDADRSNSKPAPFTVTINGRAVKAIFDTGAVRSTLTDDIAAELGIVRQPGARTANAIGAGLDHSPVWEAEVKDIEIGSEKVPSAKLMINKRLGKSSTEMVIGLDYMRNHRFLFLMGQGRILIKPNGKAIFSPPVR